MKWIVFLILTFFIKEGVANEFPTSLRAEKSIQEVENKLKSELEE